MSNTRDNLPCLCASFISLYVSGLILNLAVTINCPVCLFSFTQTIIFDPFCLPVGDLALIVINWCHWWQRTTVTFVTHPLQWLWCYRISFSSHHFSNSSYSFSYSEICSFCCFTLIISRLGISCTIS